jgi:hypothetical protein
VRLLAVAAALLHASSVAAEGFPARSGESGILDVPDAEAVGMGRGLVGLELRVDRVAGTRADVGPFPLYAVAGVTPRLEMGLTMREWGQPGDPRPSRVLFGAAAKYQLVSALASRPAIAIDVTADRFNSGEVLGTRLIASTAASGRLRLAAFVGGESGEERGVTYGGAVTVVHRSGAELALEALGGPRGENYGGALRWQLSPVAGMSLGLNYLPKDEGLRVSVGFAFGPGRKRAAPPPPVVPSAAVAAAPEPAPEELVYADDRPHFRLKLHVADATSAEPRSLRHGPRSASAEPTGAGPGRPAPAAGARPAAPSLEDLAEAQLREQEALADARERRVRASGEQLELREKAAAEQARRLEERRSELASREQQLDAREKHVAYRGPPLQQQRQLESLEAQLASQERNLGAQERSFGPAIDAAQGRERDAGAREDAERQEANRLSASVSGGASRALQIEIRKQALGARNRQLAALEARLVARGERLDALERQQRTRGEQLDAWGRRLDARAERLDLLERAAAEPRTTGATPAAPRGDPKAAGAKDKAVFVMVVKSPTVLVKERAASAPAPSTGAALHPGVAVEKAVAAATVVMFPSPASGIGELDGEAIDKIAKLAAAERCELLIWARAKDPSLMAEAQRRVAEIRTRVLAAAPLDAKQVVTRITTRPGAQGVDVVVSALRETARAPAAAAPAAPHGLLSGETGKRQIREAVIAAQPAIEACVGAVILQKDLQRAEGLLKLTVSAKGQVTRVLTGEGDLSGTLIEECLGRVSSSWLFPPAEGEYVVDVPITVIRGGGP